MIKTTSFEDSLTTGPKDGVYLYFTEQKMADPAGTAARALLSRYR